MRQLGYNVIYFIQLSRFFGLSSALYLMRKIVFSSSHATINIRIPAFRNTVQIRKSESDLAIFYQVFCELQYNLNHFIHETPGLIIDAGSNVGYSCLYFAGQYPAATIIAVEPEGTNFAQLKKNTQGYENIRPIQAGIWYKNEMIHIQDPEESNASFQVESGEGHGSAIEGVTIPHILSNSGFNEIDILKMDIEGAEFQLFNHNPHEWLTKTRCLIIELHDNFKPGTSAHFFREMSKYNWFTVVSGENIVCIKQN
ncbi:MAG TPA: FkbM family methyltransferase [Ferruginibacter sp.]|nr:FkbM family methyltransferase [Ferruginibacter sp.]HRO17446.1 FkbM family methyltransferase [Ferruginibacter sp.]HRQ21019.1 FkbM family methyltransferase [Ferruginibacter sp.]